MSEIAMIAPFWDGARAWRSATARDWLGPRAAAGDRSGQDGQVSSSRPPEDMRIPWVEEIRHRTALAAAGHAAVAGPEAFMEEIGDIGVLLGALDRLVNALAAIRDEPAREPV